MNENMAIVILNIIKRNFTVDLEIPLYISANELVITLNTAYQLGIDTTDIKSCYLKAENPIVFAICSMTQYRQHFSYDRAK